MRRVIEDLIEKRKTRRDELKASLNDLAAAVSKPGLFKKNEAEIQANVSRFQERWTLSSPPRTRNGTPTPTTIPPRSSSRCNGRSKNWRPNTPTSRPCWSISSSWKTGWTASWNPLTATQPRRPQPSCARSRNSFLPSSTPISKSASAAAAREISLRLPNTSPCSPGAGRSWTSAAAAANFWPC